MLRSYINRPGRILSITGIAGFIVALAMPANAQMADSPFGFQQQNRAAIASLIRQAEREDRNNALAQLAAPSVTNLVCGSDGKSAATGNAGCVILNNSTGHVEIGQDADGNQTATSDTNTQTNMEAAGSSDDIMAALEGTSSD